MTDPTGALQQEMAAAGLTPPAIQWDGKIHRFPGIGASNKRDASGWYRAFQDRRGALFGCWRTGLEGQWHEKVGRPEGMDAREWKAIKMKWKEESEARAREAVEAQAIVAAECTSRWMTAKPADPDHPYLVKKGITGEINPLWVRQEGDRLLVPMRSTTEGSPIWSLQSISPSGEKRFEEGGRVRGTRHTLLSQWNKIDPYYLCEGWATAWAIHHVTGAPVVIAFNVNNLEPVARYLQDTYPKAPLIIAADNDRWTALRRQDRTYPNPGVTIAREVAKELNVHVAIPDFPPEVITSEKGPTDFNDLLAIAGPEAVKKWLDPAVAGGATTTPPKEAPPTPPPPPPIDDEAPPPSPMEEEYDEDVRSPDWLKAAPFRCLGYDDGYYYYLPRGTGQITTLTATQHDRKQLIQIAPLSWWSLHFSGTSGIAWSTAADSMLRVQEYVGVFRPDRIRGRGCWPEPTEEGRTSGFVLHLGDRMLAPGVKGYADPDTYKSPAGYMYERQQRMVGPSATPLSEEEARVLLDTFQSFLWANPASGFLSAGWTVLAPVCGSLLWRPHIFLTGERGSGKSTLLRDMIAPLLADIQLYVEGQTTEAGIRQTIRSDSIPVIFDEAEEDETAGKRIQHVLALARQSSSESEGRVLKGTVGGTSLQFRVRSMFCLAAISGAVYQESDRSRISLLQLRGRSQVDSDTRARHWQTLAPKIDRVTLTTGRHLIARTMKLLKSGMLHESVRVFRKVAATALREQRVGDQYGTLYAGAWTLMSDHPPTESEARDLLMTEDLSVYQDNQRPDGVKVLDVLLQAQERIETSSGPRTVAVGELVACIKGDSGTVSEEDAEKRLRQLGMRLDWATGAWSLQIAYTSQWVEKKLRETAYARGWVDLLKTLPGVTVAATVRFHPGLRSRAVNVPYEVLEGEG